jgi:chemotaxis signal transduction protein
MIYSGEVSEIITRETPSGDVFFSLPHFFKLADRTVRHGIVLKPPRENSRNILLVSSVEREADIPPEEIFPLPEILAASKRGSFFTGIRISGQDMIAFIDPASLIARIIKDTEGGPEE